mgnify:CR=1 FL=1
MKNLLLTAMTFSIAVGSASIVHSRVEEVRSDLQCLAMNIYHEARGEPEEGQIGVAYVTLNRMNHWNWPDNICEVVWQPHQFSWTTDNIDNTPRDTERYEAAMAVAREVYLNREEDPTNGAVFYHANWVNPSWANYSSVNESWRLGVHIFYTWSGTW